MMIHGKYMYIQQKNYKSFVMTITYNLFSISSLHYVKDAITFILKKFKNVSF